MKKFAVALLRILGYLAIVVFPLFLGWGVDDLRGFLRDPARTGYACLGLLGVAALLIPRLNIQPFKRGSQVVGRGLFRAMMITSFLLTLFLPFADRRGFVTFPDREAWRGTGLALVVLGTVVRVMGLWSLGKQFSSYVTLQENHQLVQTGLYKHIRHPMYLGVLIVMAGMPLVFRSWLVILVTILTLAFVWVRMRQEERLLGEHFGSEFESYRRHTWRLLPHIY